MPPKKKQRTSGAAAAKEKASGSQTVQTALTFEELSPLQKAVGDCLEAIHSLRHDPKDAVHEDARGPLPVDDAGLFPWPVLGGGTFKDIAQRVWEDQHRFLEAVAEMLSDAGILQANSVDELLSEFCSPSVPSLLFVAAPCLVLRDSFCKFSAGISAA